MPVWKERSSEMTTRDICQGIVWLVLSDLAGAGVTGNDGCCLRFAAGFERFTVCINGEPALLPMKLALPTYATESLCTPLGSSEVVKVATLRPLTTERSMVAIGMSTPSLKKRTVPVGVPPTSADTTAVNVTSCFRVDGFREDVIAIVVLASATSSVAELLVLVALRSGLEASGSYTPWIE